MNIKEVGELILNRWESIDKFHVVYDSQEFNQLRDDFVKMPTECWLRLKEDIKLIAGIEIKKHLNTTTTTN